MEIFCMTITGVPCIIHVIAFVANINNCLLGHTDMPSWWKYKTDRQREKERNRPSRHQRLGIPKPLPRRALQPTGQTGSVAPQTPPKAPPRKRPCAAEHGESTQQGAYYQGRGCYKQTVCLSFFWGRAMPRHRLWYRSSRLPPPPAPIRQPWLPSKQWIGNNPQRAMYWRREPGPAQSQPSVVPGVAQVITVESDSSDAYSDSSDSGWCTPPRPAVAPPGTLICFEADQDTTTDQAGLHAALLTVGVHGDWFTWIQVTSRSKIASPCLDDVCSLDSHTCKHQVSTYFASRLQGSLKRSGLDWGRMLSLILALLG